MAESLGVVTTKVIDYLDSINNWLVSIETQLETANKHLARLEWTTDASLTEMMRCNDAAKQRNVPNSFKEDLNDPASVKLALDVYNQLSVGDHSPTDPSAVVDGPPW
jgi:hypothetical protein